MRACVHVFSLFVIVLSQPHTSYCGAHIYYSVADINKWKRYRPRKQCLIATQCAVCDQETLWEHRIRCLQMDRHSKGNLRNISPLRASPSTPPGECVEIPRLNASVCESPPTLLQRGLPSRPVPRKLESDVSCK